MSMVRFTAFCLLLSATAGARAGTPLPPAEAAAWLQKIAEASRHISYEGVFTFQQGGAPQSQTLMVTGRPTGTHTESRLLTLDGNPREVRCTQQLSVTLMLNGSQQQAEKRLNRRHFPDLLPENAAVLANWYTVSLGTPSRAAGRDCTTLEITPKDVYRWGYILCVDKNSAFPLRAIMTNDEGQPLMQYSFADLKLGALPKMADHPMPALPEAAKPATDSSIETTELPPGFNRIAAVRRQLPNRKGEVEHWVFSDGLTHVSLFLEPAQKPVAPIKGQSKQGMINMIKRQIGEFQATVLGEAPWATVEHIALHLEARATP